MMPNLCKLSHKMVSVGREFVHTSWLKRWETGEQTSGRDECGDRELTPKLLD